MLRLKATAAKEAMPRYILVGNRMNGASILHCLPAGAGSGRGLRSTNPAGSKFRGCLTVWRVPCTVYL